MATTLQGCEPFEVEAGDVQQVLDPKVEEHVISITSHPSNSKLEKSASEINELETPLIDWKKMKTRQFWFRREWLWYYLALVILCVVGTLVIAYHKQIVHWFTPVAQWLHHDIKFGWLVPIAVFFIISFPPLFGHEVVALICGLVWGVRDGFLIVCAGTLLGEVGNYYFFKYLCRAQLEKREKTDLSYACLAKVCRDGSFIVVFVARLSAIPGHFTTPVFSASGMGIVVFLLATVLSFPKQLLTVYLGVMLEQSGQSNRKTSSRSKLISDSVIGFSVLFTIFSVLYIYYRMNKVKNDVILERRKARKEANNPSPATDIQCDSATVHLDDGSVTSHLPAPLPLHLSPVRWSLPKGMTTVLEIDSENFSRTEESYQNDNETCVVPASSRGNGITIVSSGILGNSSTLVSTPQTGNPQNLPEPHTLISIPCSDGSMVDSSKEVAVEIRGSTATASTV